MRLNRIFPLEVAAIGLFTWLVFSLSTTRGAPLKDTSVEPSPAPQDPSRRVGDRETTDLPTHYIKEVVNRQPRPLPDTRCTQSEVHRMGSRLRTPRFAKVEADPGKR